MNIFKYNNFNCDFTFYNICPYLESFWLKKVIISNYSKIWLTIIVNNDTKSTILIDNIPFNTYDYSDITIVLKRAINSKLFELNNINSITFEYFMEKEIVIKNNSWTIGKFLDITFFLIILLLLFFYIEMLFDDSVKEVLSKGIDINDKYIKLGGECIEKKSLNPFINMFNKDSTCYYFPSYFLPSKINATVDDFNLLEYILYKQYHVLNVHSTITKEYMEGVHDIITQYVDLNERIILDYSNAILGDNPL